MHQIPKTEIKGPLKAGNTSSPENESSARPWTPDEMAAAKPLPVPKVDDPMQVGTSGSTHSGRGQTKPSGRPEKEK